MSGLLYAHPEFIEGFAPFKSLKERVGSKRLARNAEPSLSNFEGFKPLKSPSANVHRCNSQLTP